LINDPHRLSIQPTLLIFHRFNPDFAVKPKSAGSEAQPWSREGVCIALSASPNCGIRDESSIGYGFTLI
jgi:hypothetical protein